MSRIVSKHMLQTAVRLQGSISCSTPMVSVTLVRRHFSTDSVPPKTNAPKTLFSPEQIKKMYEFEQGELATASEPRSLEYVSEKDRRSATELIEQRLQQEVTSSFVNNPIDQAIEMYNQIAKDGLSKYQKSRELANLASGFNFPGPRFLPREPRPISVAETNKSIYEAVYDQEDYELGWYRYTRILSYVPNTCKTAFIPFVGIEKKSNDTIYDYSKYEFERDAESLSLALYTCISARESLERIHSPEIMEQAKLLVSTADNEYVTASMPSLQYTPKDSASLSAGSTSSSSSSSSSSSTGTSTTGPKRISNGKRQVKKILAAEEIDAQSTSSSTSVSMNVDGVESSTKTTSTPQADAETTDSMNHATNADHDMDMQHHAPKLVIMEDGVEKTLDIEEQKVFLEQYKQLCDQANQQMEYVYALRTHVRTNEFSELRYVYTELSSWTSRLEFVCSDILGHYSYLLSQVNNDLYQLLTSNRSATGQKSISGTDAYITSIGNDLTLLRLVIDASRAANLYVIYQEAMTLYMHMNMYLEQPPSLPLRKNKLVQRLQSATSEEEKQKIQERIDQLQVSMVKVPIIYMGQHKTVSYTNDYKNIKFLELSSLSCLLSRTEVMDIAKGLQETAQYTHEYMISHGMDERLITLPENLRGTHLLGKNTGIRVTATSSNYARLGVAVLDGFLIDFVRQLEGELPAEYINLIEKNSMVSYYDKDAETGNMLSRKGSIFGMIPKNRLSREKYWSKVKSKELSESKMIEFPVHVRLSILNNEHEGKKQLNVLSRVMEAEPEFLELYMALARQAGDKVSLGKALVLWRASTHIFEWVKLRMDNSLYADMHDDPEKLMEQQLNKKTNLVDEAMDNEMDAEEINTDGASNESRRKEISDMITKRLYGVTTAAHIDMTVDRMIGYVSLVQYLAYKKINFFNLGIPSRVYCKCYTDELSAIWIVAKQQLAEIRELAVQDHPELAEVFKQVNRPEEELLPFELEYSKIALMCLEAMVLEQNVSSAKIFARQIYNLGLVPKQMLVDFFMDVDVELDLEA